MSMEQAILEHASALNNLAAAIRDALNPQAHGAIASAIGKTVQTVGDVGNVAAPAEQKAEAVKPDAELEKAVEKVEQRAAAEKAPSTEPEVIDGLDDKPLNYVDDVRPVLLQAIKKVGKEQVQALLGQFGVDKGDKLKAEQLAAVRDAAQKLAA